MENAILTGFDGQMGRAFIELLKGENVQIIGVAPRFDEAHWKDEHFIRERLSITHTDIARLIEKHKPTYFINCAARSRVADSWENPEDYLMINGVTVARHLQAIKMFSPKTRYITFGSGEEFDYRNNNEEPRDESSPLFASNPYGASKIYARHILNIYRKQDIYAVMPWCFNVESAMRGPTFLTQKLTRSISNIDKAIKAGESFEPISVGNIWVTRDFSLCDEIVRGAWLLLHQDKPKDYILSSGRGHKIKDVIYMICSDCFGYNCCWRYVNGGDITLWNFDVKKPLVIVNPALFRPNDISYMVGNPKLAERELGWKTERNLLDILRVMEEANANIRSTY